MKVNRQQIIYCLVKSSRINFLMKMFLFFILKEGVEQAINNNHNGEFIVKDIHPNLKGIKIGNFIFCSLESLTFLV